MSADYESVICVKNEVFVYNIPPRPSARGYRAADWNLDKPDWTGRLRVIARGDQLTLKLEDRDSGQLFAKCPVDAFPGPSVEAVMDSSRYFVIRVVSDAGQKAFVGMGFADRSDSFDLNVSIQDHFKWARQEKDRQEQGGFDPGPKLDLGFKEGQTIKINVPNKGASAAGKRQKPGASAGGGAGGAVGILPPPPGGTGVPLIPAPTVSGGQSSDPGADAWGDFSSASGKPSQGGGWVTF